MDTNVMGNGMLQGSASLETDRHFSLQLPEANTLKLATRDRLIEISHDPGIPGSGVTWHQALTQSQRTERIESWGQSEFLNAQIPLAGSFRMETADGVEVSSANVGLTRSKDNFALYDVNAGETHHLFNIRVELEVTASWFGDKLPAALRPFLAETPSKSLHYPAAVPWCLQETLKQALSYEMPLRRLAIEAVSLQIMTSMLHRLCDGAPQESELSTREVKAAHEAHAILLSRLDNPPLTAELAAQLGLSTRRLERAFREVFGVSVFEASDKARFDAACQALLEGAPIKAVALNLNYASASSFTYAFRRRFGLPPGQWLARK